MKRKVTVTMLLTLLLPMVLGAITAFADATKVGVSLTKQDGTAMSKVFDNANGKLGIDNSGVLKVTLQPTAPENGGTEQTLLSYDSNKVTFNQTNFDNATPDSRKKVMSAYVQALQESAVSKQGQQSVIDGLSASSKDVSTMLIPMVMDSTSADLYTAMKWVNPILPIVRVIFGVGAICISIFLIGSTIVDLCFIGLPIAREALQNKGDQKGSGKVPFVSADAMSVIKESESSLDSSGGYKNAYLIYFKRRVLTYIIIAVCLLYLIVGELGGLISWLLSLGSGIV